MQGHAVSNVVPVVAANRVGNEDGQVFYGTSFIADHVGEIVTDMNRTEQGTISFGPEIRLRRGTLQLRGAYSHFRDQFLRRVRDGAQSGAATDTHEQLGQLQMRYLHAFSDAHVLTVGYDAFVESLEHVIRRATISDHDDFDVRVA